MNDEIPAIMETVENYIRAVQKLDFNLVKKAWLPEGHRWIIDPETDLPHKMLSASHEDVISRIKGKDGPEYTAGITMIEYSGTAASVKIEWHEIKKEEIGEVN